MAKKTIWLRRCGFVRAGDPGWCEGEFTPKYEVVKTANTFEPRVGDRLAEPDALALINDETTVNIS